MRSGEVVLSVDYGAVRTKAVVVGGDGAWAPVRFDGDESLDSAVFLAADGSWVTGASAWQWGAAEPGRFETSPLRWLLQERLVLGGAEVDVVDAVAATLRQVVGRAAARLGGAPVGEVRLVVPPSWGPRWRTAMREAARRAGLGRLSLVDAASSVASHVVAAGGGLVVGSFVAVCDWGGCGRVSVLRRGAYGFEVLSTIEAPDGGGLAMDQVLAQQLPVLAGTDPQATAAAGGVVAWAVARGAREALSRAAAVTVSLPPGPPVVVDAASVLEGFVPVVKRMGETLRAAVAAAEVPVERLAGVYCAGGVASSPAMVEMLRRETGWPLTVVDDAGRAAVLGAARVSGPSVDVPAPVPAEPPVPGWRRAAAAVLPGAASLGLFTQFVMSAALSRAPGISYDPYSYLLANWGELAMVTLFCLLACLSAATVLAAVVPVADPVAADGPAGRVRSSVGVGLLASCAGGLSLACMYAVFASVVLQWSNAPFLRWAVLPLLPVVMVVAVTAWVASRFGREPAQGWHGWLDFPGASVFAAALGMALVQLGDSTATADAGDAVTLQVVQRFGGVLLALGMTVAVVGRWRYRLLLLVPAGVFCVSVAGPATTGVLAGLYVAAVTWWWVQRLWQLGQHPAGSLPGRA